MRRGGLTRGIRDITREDLVDEFIRNKFHESDFSKLNPDMLSKLKKYLLSELHKKELLFNYNFNRPSSFNFMKIFENNNFLNSLVAILRMDQDKQPKKKKGKRGVAKGTEPGEEVIVEEETSDEVKYVDSLFARIGQVLDDTSSNSLKIMTSFYKLRENYFRLNNMQRTEIMKKNPDLILQLIELEDQLVLGGVILPSEVYHLSNRKNYSAFGMKPIRKSPNEDILEDLLEFDENDVSESHVKNRLIFRNFMETVGVDMEFTEKCFAMSQKMRKSREKKKDYEWGELLDLEENTQVDLQRKMRRKVRKMLRYGRAKKMIGAMKVLEYLEVLMGDSIDSDQNYRIKDFEVMFNFEKNTRKLLEDYTVSRELNEMQEPYDIVDSDHTNIARYCAP